jgi:hypothetical protein
MASRVAIVTYAAVQADSSLVTVDGAMLASVNP